MGDAGLDERRRYEPEITARVAAIRTVRVYQPKKETLVGTYKLQPVKKVL